IEVYLYRGDGASAWRCAEEMWRALESSLLVRAAPLVNIGRYLRALAALAVGGADLVRIAEDDAAQYERQDAPVTRVIARLLRAGVAERRGDADEAASLFADAETDLDALGMRLYAAAARLRRGQIANTSALVASAEAAMSARAIAAPRKMLRML